jgi:hypothetical protein
MDKWFVDERPETHGLCLNGHDAITDAIDAMERFAKSRKRFDVLLKLPGSSAELPLIQRLILPTAGQIGSPEWNNRANRKTSRNKPTHRQACLALIQLLSSARL